MHALIINGSPKRAGSTGQLCEQFANGLAETGGTARIVCLGDTQIGFCRGCGACLDSGQCVIDDGMGGVVKDLLACDVLVLASPAYWGDVTAQMKAFIDRSRWLCDHYQGKYVCEGKAGVAIAVRAGKAVGENLHLIECLDHYLGHLGFSPAGRLTVEGVQAPQDLTDEHKASAYDLGRAVGGQK